MAYMYACSMHFKGCHSDLIQNVPKSYLISQYCSVNPCEVYLLPHHSKQLSARKLVEPLPTSKTKIYSSILLVFFNPLSLLRW